MNQYGFLNNEEEEMKKVKIFLILVIFSTSALFCSQTIERELVGNISRVAHGLFTGCHIEKSEVQDIFSEIEEIDKIKKWHNDHERDSEGSKDSHQSAVSDDTISSVDSHAAIDGMDKIMDACFEEQENSRSQIEQRKGFIDMLYSLEDSVSPEIMTKTILMISEQLMY